MPLNNSDCGPNAKTGTMSAVCPLFVNAVTSSFFVDPLFIENPPHS